MKRVILTGLLLAFGSSSWAQDRKLINVPENTAFNININDLDSNSVYYQFSYPKPFLEWQSNSPAEHEFLNLYDGYKEPMLLSRETRTPTQRKLTMFVARSRFVISKAASQIDLKSLVSVSFLQKLDPELRHAQISPSQIMMYTAGKPDNQNFKALCNSPKDKEPSINRPSLELDLSNLSRPSKNWCSDTERSVCVESCYLFTGKFKSAFYAHNKLKSVDYQKKDLGIATQSELRYFNSEAEMGKRISVASLTGINTPVRGVIEQNAFYVNQLFQYAKVIAFFQEHPKDATKTIVTAYFVSGIQADTYDKSYLIVDVKDVLMGNSMLNQPSGITAGLPIYTQNMARSLATILEK